MFRLVITIGGGIGLIIYSISLFLKINRKEVKDITTTRKSALLFLFFGLTAFIGGTYFATFQRDKNIASKPHQLYKDLTFDEWKAIVNNAMNDYKDCTKNMDKGSYQFQSICIQSVSHEEDDFNNDLDTKANLSQDQIQQLKDYWVSQWTETRNSVNAQIEENDRKNYPNKY